MAKKIVVRVCTNKSAGYERYKDCDNYFIKKYGTSLNQCANNIVKYFGKQLLLKPVVVLIDPWLGYNNKFDVTLYEKYGDNKSDKTNLISFRVETDGKFTIDNIKLSNIKSDIFTENYAKQIVDTVAANLYNSHITAAGLNPTGSNNVSYDIYNNYNNTGKTGILTGTLFEIFDAYTTMNDRMRYINGSYYRFTDAKVANLYSEFIKNYHGNFFLDNAVRRGCIID